MAVEMKPWDVRSSAEYSIPQLFAFRAYRVREENRYHVAVSVLYDDFKRRPVRLGTNSLAMCCIR